MSRFFCHRSARTGTRIPCCPRPTYAAHAASAVRPCANGQGKDVAATTRQIAHGAHRHSRAERCSCARKPVIDSTPSERPEHAAPRYGGPLTTVRIDILGDGPQPSPHARAGRGCWSDPTAPVRADKCLGLDNTPPVEDQLDNEEVARMLGLAMMPDSRLAGRTQGGMPPGHTRGSFWEPDTASFESKRGNPAAHMLRRYAALLTCICCRERLHLRPALFASPSKVRPG